MVNALRFRDDSEHEEPAVTLESFLGQSNATAVRIEPGDDARALIPHLDQLALIDVSFPKFRDGRGYSATNLEFRVTSWLSLLGSVSTVGRQSVNARVSKDY